MRLILIVLVLSCTGCATSSGRLSSEGRHRVPVDEIVIPPNAPSIVSDFADRTSFSGHDRGHSHTGIDIIANRGHPVIAPASGIVRLVQPSARVGLFIIIDHGSHGSWTRFETRYLHLDEAFVEEGEEVIRGQKIATVGTDGWTSNYTHLHFSIAQGVSNPHRHWIGGVGKIVCFEGGKEFAEHDDQFLTYPLACYGNSE